MKNNIKDKTFYILNLLISDYETGEISARDYLQYHKALRFIITLYQDNTPLTSKRKTLIKKIINAISLNLKNGIIFDDVKVASFENLNKQIQEDDFELNQ